MRRVAGQAFAALAIGLLAGCGSDGQPALAPPASPTTSSLRAAYPSTTASTGSWTVIVTADVRADDGSEPFTLRSAYPVTFSAVADPVIATLEATAPEPLLVVGGAEIFSARMAGPGVLDIAGPTCVDGGVRFKHDFCSADPSIIPIGTTYKDATGPKPTGPVLDAKYLRLALDARALEPGVYSFQEQVNWVSARADVNAPLNAATVTIRFEASRSS